MQIYYHTMLDEIMIKLEKNRTICLIHHIQKTFHDEITVTMSLLEGQCTHLQEITWSTSPFRA